jgi:hypothetical protein
VLTEIVQHAAASTEVHGLALEVAGIIAGEINAGHDSADERIGGLISLRLCRTICPLPQDESREHYQRAVEAAELADDNVNARWDALPKISRAPSRNRCAGPGNLIPGGPMRRPSRTRRCSGSGRPRAAGSGIHRTGSEAGLGQHLAQVDNGLGVDVFVAGRVEVFGPGPDGHGDLAAVLFIG